MRLYALSIFLSAFLLFADGVSRSDRAAPDPARAVLGLIDRLRAFVGLAAIVSRAKAGASPSGNPTGAGIAETDRRGGAAPSPADPAEWVALSGCGVVLLLAVTNHLTQNIIAIPFLWVLPLNLYLLSFILCFHAPGLYIRSCFWHNAARGGRAACSPPCCASPWLPAAGIISGTTVKRCW